MVDPRPVYDPGVTVAAVILAATPVSAIADADGRPAVRRIAEVAWAGGAVPIVVVSHDPTGEVAGTLTGSPAILAEPAPAASGPVGQIVRGIDVAVAQVGETEAILVWPARFVWADAETVTSLIEAHGADAGAILRPTFSGQAGWPVLVPVAHRAALAVLRADHSPDDLIDDLTAAGATVRAVELGDPGATHDGTVSRASLPAYEGPAEPVAGPPPEWGAPAGERPEDVPLAGPALAPYVQAEAEAE